MGKASCHKGAETFMFKAIYAKDNSFFPYREILARKEGKRVMSPKAPRKKRGK